MTTALALWTPPTLVMRRRTVEPVMLFAIDSPRARLHFAFLASIKRIMVQAGRFPDEIGPSMHKGHEEWWQRCSRSALGTHVLMQEASLEEVTAIVVPVAKGIDLDSPILPWYPDSWRPLVAWAAAGARGAPVEAPVGMRVVASGASTVDRMRNMSVEERLDAQPIERPSLRVVQVETPNDAGPLFGPPPGLVQDMEAEFDETNGDGWEGF